MIEIQDDLPSGIVVFSDDGQILEANRQFVTFVAQNLEDLEGRRIDSILNVAGRIFFQTHLFPLLKMSGRIEEAHISMLSAQGEEVPIMMNAVRKERNGTEINLAVVVPMRRRIQHEEEILAARRNLEAASAEKDRANEELRKLTDEMEIRVTDRTAALVSANAEMEGFAYSIAHDLRAPLRAISSTSHILIEEAGPQLSSDHVELLERQASNAERLGRLIDDLLKFSRLSRSEFDRSPIDMTAMAKDVVDELLQAAMIEDCQYDIQTGITANADPRLVRIVLSNLLHNACKFSPNGGRVTFRSQSQAGETVYEVQDLGVGFDMAFADKLFKPFQRLVADHEFPGTGIGLANVQRIVRRHGGRIWAEAALNKGATFRFTLTAPMN